MRQFRGQTVLTWRQKLGTPSRGQRLPQSGERVWWVEVPNRFIRMHFIVHKGIRATAWVPVGRPDRTYYFADQHRLKGTRMKRRQPAQKGTPAIPLSKESVAWELCPLLRDFLVDTAYEDGTRRTPGEAQFGNQFGSLQCVLRDPDSGMRTLIRSITFDTLLMAVEAHLGAEDAPWEVDQWLTAQLEKKNKKRA